MKKPCKHSIVEVLWKDAASTQEAWLPQKKSSAPGLVWVSTVGFVVEWRKKLVTISMSLNPAQYGKLVSIPRAGIRAWRILADRPSDDSEVWDEGCGRAKG